MLYVNYNSIRLGKLTTPEFNSIDISLLYILSLLVSVRRAPLKFSFFFLNSKAIGDYFDGKETTGGRQGQVQKIMDKHFLERSWKVDPNIPNNQQGKTFCFVPNKWMLVNVRFLGESVTFLLKRKGKLIKDHTITSREDAVNSYLQAWPHTSCHMQAFS